MSASAAMLAAVLVFNPATAAAPPTYVLSGTGLPGMSMSDEDIVGIASGYLSGGHELPYPHSVIGMDNSIRIGADVIVSTILSGHAPVRVAGISQGALAISEAKRMIMALPEEQRPGRDQLVFVALGDPSSPGGLGSRFPGMHLSLLDATLSPAPETPYDTIFITREYDGFADFPDRPANLLAAANAILGIVYVHPFYGAEVDLDAVPADNVTQTTNDLGGTDTSYLVPTERLPLAQALHDLNVDERVLTAIEEPLRKLVDAGYSRNDHKPDFRDPDSDDSEDQDDRQDATPLRATFTKPDSAGHRRAAESENKPLTATTGPDDSAQDDSTEDEPSKAEPDPSPAE